MSGLEAALVILVGVWTLIFAIIAVSILLIFLSIRRAIKKANNLLDKAEAEADKVNLPSKLIISSIMAFVARNSFQSIKDAFKRDKK
jgi:hypothetical protein